jgi:hypothetical protein
LGKCDNCKTGLIVKEKDYTKEAGEVVEIM